MGSREGGECGLSLTWSSCGPGHTHLGQVRTRLPPTVQLSHPQLSWVQVIHQSCMCPSPEAQPSPSKQEAPPITSTGTLLSKEILPSNTSSPLEMVVIKGSQTHFPLAFYKSCMLTPEHDTLLMV